jgi:hypothetical protein
MPFPDFEYCIICEGIRPEIGGKFTILGFYGLAPHVEVVITNPAQPVNLAFLAAFPPVGDAHTVYEYSIVITRPGQVVLHQTPQSRLQVSLAGRGLVAFGFVISPPYIFGTYSIRIIVNHEVKLDNTFRLRAASPPELANLGIFTNPPRAH